MSHSKGIHLQTQHRGREFGTGEEATSSGRLEQRQPDSLPVPWMQFSWSSQMSDHLGCGIPAKNENHNSLAVRHDTEKSGAFRRRMSCSSSGNMGVRVAKTEENRTERLALC